MSVSTNTSRSVTINYALSAIVGIGAIIGFSKGSTSSLLAGGIVSAVFASSAYLKNMHISLLGSLLLTGIMAQRYLETKKPMPAFPLIALAAGNVAFQLYALSHVTVKASSSKMF